MRFATDTGGTFTDLIVERDDGTLAMYKASTTPSDPVRGVLDALGQAAADHAMELEEFLMAGDVFIHGTTHAINAIITGNTAKTAFLTTKGHPDILLIREGGRTEPFNHTVPYPDAYVPRALTFEVPERINHAGEVVDPLDEGAVVEMLATLKVQNVEAVAVCLLWSISNPAHEMALGALIEKHLPGVPYTLSHRLNPTLREYRRASSACIDASLKPLMGRYLGSLTERLRDAGFDGKVFVVSSQGGMMEAGDLAAAPIHAINSGPSMAPIAGRTYAGLDDETGPVIVADTGGTTYDVSLVRQGRIPMTREMWIGDPYRGHMTGFPSVDVKSIGAGGGSIAWVDAGGVLHVGPQSAGSEPGPACYNRGGTEPTLTDACLVLGYLDPDYFLGGTMEIAPELSEKAIMNRVAKPLNLTLEEAAWAIVDLATENMTQAIVDITVNQGIDPADAVLIGGGGAAGLNSTFIARRLGCSKLIIPEVGAALSASGALLSDLSMEYRMTRFMTTGAFDMIAANEVMGVLRDQCTAFAKGPGQGAVSYGVEFTLEARYPNQVWEIEIPLPVESFSSIADIDALKDSFHATHENIFAIKDAESDVEVVTWTATVRCRMREGDSVGRLAQVPDSGPRRPSRKTYFGNAGHLDAAVVDFDSLKDGEIQTGPAVVESPFTTVVIDPGARFRRTAAGSLVIEPAKGEDS